MVPYAVPCLFALPFALPYDSADGVSHSDRPYSSHIANARQDPRFRVDDGSDQKHARHIAVLCIPVLDAVRKERIAVLEMTGKKGITGVDACFSKDDETLAMALVALAAVSIAKASVYQGLKDCATKMNEFLDVLVDPRPQESEHIANEIYEEGIDSQQI